MWVILVIIMSLTTKITMSNQIPLLLWRSPRLLLGPAFPITHALFLCFYTLFHCPKSQIYFPSQIYFKDHFKEYYFA